jgi:HEAT repeat protein
MNAHDEAIQKVRVARANGDIAYLLDALRDPDVRSWAAGYLGKLRASEAVPDLITVAQRDPETGPQTHAIGALGQIGDHRALPVLLPLLENPSWFVRTSAAWALVSLRTRR